MVAAPEATPDAIFKVMTLGQDGEIREREAGKGNNYPEWRGAFFADGSSTWFAAKTGDLVYSSIDLWKGCISVVPKQFDEALVTKEFPIFEITDPRLTPEFVQALLRTSYYQRAFRAITTGHSNRRRTQQEDFEALEICFPATTSEQVSLVRSLANARIRRKSAEKSLTVALSVFGEIVEGKRTARMGFNHESVEMTIAQIQAMPTLDNRSAEEILGYVINGVAK
jgi:type I restriction enzyme M protein